VFLRGSLKESVGLSQTIRKWLHDRRIYSSLGGWKEHRLRPVIRHNRGKKYQNVPGTGDSKEKLVSTLEEKKTSAKGEEDIKFAIATGRAARPRGDAAMLVSPGRVGRDGIPKGTSTREKA